MEELNLRVGMQSRIGTTLLWNKAALTAEQGRSFKVFARLVTEGVVGEWAQPRTVRPPLTGNLATVVDANTEFTMIPHVVTGALNERVTFDVMFEFGEGDDKRSAVLRVDPYGHHTQFIKAKRVEMGPDKKPEYGQPVYILDISDQAAKKIAKALNNKGE